jgi:Zn-dependent protease with chaperone function
MDLLTVVAHELGHIAGLDDLAVQPGSLMSSTLSAGVRHTAWSAAVDTFFGDSGRQ